MITHGRPSNVFCTYLSVASHLRTCHLETAQLGAAAAFMLSSGILRTQTEDQTPD